MIKDLQKIIRDYSETYAQAKVVHNQAVAYIGKNYVEGSELYNSAMRTATATFQDAVIPMKGIYREKIKTEFEAVRKAIREAVSVAPSSEVFGLVGLMKEKKLSESEIQMFCEKYGTNYMNAKLLADASGKPFKAVETVLDEVNRLEAGVNGFIDSYSGATGANMSYRNAVLLNGAQIDHVNQVTEAFLTAYGQKG